jgi:hypothetical protein
MATASTHATRVPARFEGACDQAVTLLELVGAVCDVTEDDAEVVATVLHMLHSGQVRLCGNFRGVPIQRFE